MAIDDLRARRARLVTTLQGGDPDAPAPGLTVEPGTKPAATRSQLEQLTSRMGRRVEALRDDLMGVDRSFDRAGVPDFTFRSDFSRMDTDEERVEYLNRQVGAGGWTTDKFGNYALTPSGMDRMQLEHSGKPVLIDEPELTRFDVADVRGDLPAIAGATLAGVGTGGAGLVAGVLATAGGAAALKGIDEAADAFRGDNLQSPGEMAMDLAKEAAFAGTGETIARTVMLPIGRKMLAPQVGRVTPEAREIMEDAAAIGARPNVAQITRAPLLGRSQEMMNRIFGDPLAFTNSKALGDEMSRLTAGAGQKIANRTNLGELIQTNIKAARRAFSADSSAMYQVFDDVVGGRALVPTYRVKQVAQSILDDIPKNVEGRAIMAAPETMTQIGGVLQLPDFISGKQMQALRSRLLDASRVSNLVPGLETRHARLLREAADGAFQDMGDQSAEMLARQFDVDLGSEEALKAFGEGGPQQLVQNARDALNRANAYYREGVSKFDNNLIARITRDPSFAGSVDPETIVDMMFRKGRASNVNRVMAVLPERVRGNVRRAAIEDIMDSMTDGVTDPIRPIFTGARFLKTLEGYGTETLESMFGKQRTEELFRLGRVAQVVTSRQDKSGGLVAAGIALHPLQNLTKLMKLRVMSKIMNSENGVKWLTVGLDAPKTRAGASALTRLYTQAQMLAEEEMQLQDEALMGEPQQPLAEQPPEVQRTAEGLVRELRTPEGGF